MWLLVGDRGKAEDLAQETLWRLHRAWRRLDDPRAADAYVWTCLVRLAARARARRWTGERPTPPDQLAPLSNPSATAEVDDALVLRRALADLSEDQRAVLVLRYYEGWSEAEIAEIVGCAPGTVKSRATRGLAALRAHPQLADLDDASAPADAAVTGRTEP